MLTFKNIKKSDFSSWSEKKTFFWTKKMSKILYKFMANLIFLFFLILWFQAF